MSYKEKTHAVQINDRLYCEAGVMARALNMDIEAFTVWAFEDALIKGKERLEALNGREPLDYEKLLDDSARVVNGVTGI